MAIGLEAWENIISQQVNGAPLPTMMDAVRDAAIEFCKRTRVDSAIVRDIDFVLDDEVIDVPEDDDYSGDVPSSVITVWTADGVLPAKTKRELEAQFPNGWVIEPAVATTSELYGWISLRPATIRLVPLLSADMTAAISIDVCYQPGRDTVEVKDFLYEHYAEEIGYGAIARLHTHAEAKYAMPERASGYLALFERAIKKVADQHVGGHNKKRLRTGGDRI